MWHRIILALLDNLCCHWTPLARGRESGLKSHRIHRQPFKSYLSRASLSWASLVAQTVQCLPAMQETWVWSLGWEDPLEKEMTTHSSTLAWKIPRTEEPGRLQYMGSQRVRHDWEWFHFTKLPLEIVRHITLSSHMKLNWITILTIRCWQEHWVCTQMRPMYTK